MNAVSDGGSGGFTVVPTELLVAEAQLDEMTEEWDLLARQLESVLRGAVESAGDLADAFTAAAARSSLDDFGQHTGQAAVPLGLTAANYTSTDSTVRHGLWRP